MNTVTRKKAEPLKLIIIGGGYAGLSALITLRKQAPDAEITLIDPRPYHLIITRLHETVHRPLDTIRVSYSLLAKRFDFIHKQQAIQFDEHQLRAWDSNKGDPAWRRKLAIRLSIDSYGFITHPISNRARCL